MAFEGSEKVVECLPRFIEEVDTGRRLHSALGRKQFEDQIETAFQADAPKSGPERHLPLRLLKHCFHRCS
jgi:hypothetical protein